jgi:hypothetical protein
MKEGKRGAWEFEDKVIDRPVVRNAKRTVYLARDYGIDVERATTIISSLEEIGEVREPEMVDDPTYHQLKIPPGTGKVTQKLGYE